MVATEKNGCIIDPCEHLENSHFIVIMYNSVDLAVHIDRGCVYLLV